MKSVGPKILNFYMFLVSIKIVWSNRYSNFNFFDLNKKFNLKKPKTHLKSYKFEIFLQFCVNNWSITIFNDDFCRIICDKATAIAQW